MWKSDWTKKRRKTIILMAGLTFLLILVQIVLFADKNAHLKKENQYVIAIEKSDGKVQSFPMIVEMENNGEITRYEATISLKADGTVNDKKEGNHGRDNEEMVNTSLNQMVRFIEREEGPVIYLPQQMEDGTRIFWKSADRPQLLAIILIFPLSLYFFYRNDQEKRRKMILIRQDSIRKALPGFCDRILLMLNCGLIFQDAFIHIVDNCQEKMYQDAFTELVNSIKREADETGKTIATVMKDRCGFVGMKEYSKIANIIADNQYRGINLEEKLQSESILLWEGRKADAMQKGKEIETKMAFPLALLLLVLILISGVPAMMNM